MIQLAPLSWLNDLIPETTASIEEQVVSNMRRNGFCAAYPIITFKGQILAGRCRYRACVTTGTMPTTKEYLGEGGAPEVFAYMDNLTRLTERQRLACAAAVTRWMRTIDVFSRLEPGREVMDDEQRIHEIAALSHLKKPTIKRVRKILELGSPELIEAFKRDKVSMLVACQLIKKSKGEQTRAILAMEEKALKRLDEYRVHDARNTTVPDHLREVFMSKLNEHCKDALTQAIRKIEKMVSWNPHARLEWIERLRAVRGDVDACRPWYMHRECKGAGCDGCGGLGWEPRGFPKG